MSFVDKQYSEGTPLDAVTDDSTKKEVNLLKQIVKDFGLKTRATRKEQIARETVPFWQLLCRLNRRAIASFSHIGF
jgi:hypothetical protein